MIWYQPSFPLGKDLFPWEVHGASQQSSWASPCPLCWQLIHLQFKTKYHSKDQNLEMVTMKAAHCNQETLQPQPPPNCLVISKRNYRATIWVGGCISLVKLRISWLKQVKTICCFFTNQFFFLNNQDAGWEKQMQQSHARWEKKG